MLLLGLLNGFNASVQQNPAVSADTKTQIAAATEKGIPIVTTEQAHQALLDAGRDARPRRTRSRPTTPTPSSTR